MNEELKLSSREPENAFIADDDFGILFILALFSFLYPHENEKLNNPLFRLCFSKNSNNRKEK